MNTLASSALSLHEINELDCLRGFLMTWTDIHPQEVELRALRQVTGTCDDYPPRHLLPRGHVRLPKRPPHILMRPRGG